MLSNANKLLSVMLLNAILLNVVMPSVVAPLSKPREKAAALTLSQREREREREREESNVSNVEFHVCSDGGRSKVVADVSCLKRCQRR